MQIVSDIHALKIPFYVEAPEGKVPRFVYVYMICGEKICLIDSGVASSEKIIFDYIKRLGRSLEDISLLILTHSHPDHIGAASAVNKATGCEVAAHDAEKAWIEDVYLQARERPVPGFKTLVGGSVKVDRILKDGDVLSLEEGLCLRDEPCLRVIHTPGHSRGSISLWLPEECALFSADAVPLKGEMPIYEDIVESALSIKRLKSVQGIELLLSSWDDPRRDERAYQIMDEGLEYLQRIHEAVLMVAGSSSDLDSMELCRRVLRELGIPGALANPLVARSFLASIKAMNQKNAISGGRGE